MEGSYEGIYEIVNDELQEKQVLVNLVNDELKKLSDDKQDRDLYLSLREFEIREHFSSGKSFLEFIGDKSLDEKIETTNKRIYERSEMLKEHKKEYFQSLEFLNEFYKNSLLRSSHVIEMCIVENDLDAENNAMFHLINFAIRGDDEYDYLSLIPDSLFKNADVRRKPISGILSSNLNSLDFVRDLFWNLMLKTDPYLSEKAIFMEKGYSIDSNDAPFLKFLIDDNYASQIMDVYLQEIYPALESFDIISRTEIKKKLNSDFIMY